MQNLYGFLFLPIRKIKNNTRAIMAITIKIPTPIPALKMPSTTLHELIRKNKAELIRSLSVFKNFI